MSSEELSVVDIEIIHENQKLNEMFDEKQEEIRKRCEENRKRYRKEQAFLKKIKENMKHKGR